MNKASCLSLVSNAILYWNTIKTNDIVTNLRVQGEVIEDETLAHISLLPFEHVVPNGTYFGGTKYNSPDSFEWSWEEGCPPYRVRL